MSLTAGSTKLESHHGDGPDGPTSSAGDPDRPTQRRTINVLLFSDAVAKKNSVINLLAREEVAVGSSEANGCAMESTRYDVSIDSMDFAVFDTIGLGKPQMGTNDYLRAIEKAHELILKLIDAGGIHLLLFCVLGGTITATTQSNYRLFFECLCGTQVPIALAFTSLGERAKIEGWWTRYESYMEHYGIRHDGHICLRAAQDTFGDDPAESQKKLVELLKTCALKDQAFSLEPHSWLARFTKASQSFIRKLKNPKRRDIMQILTHRCQVSPQVARKIANMIDGGQAGQTSSTVNVVLFGETGVGKSAVVNLISRREVTHVSSDADGCTMRSTPYDISFDDTNFTVYDTIGLVQPQIEVSGYLNAIENAYDLVAELGAAGGIHLLLFCMRGGRITPTTQLNYRLFYEYLCSKKVPVALVFTGLERETEMEDWWTRNKTDIEDRGIEGDGHACITTIQDDALGQDLKYTESQRTIRELLKTCALREAFMPQPHTSLSGLGGLMRGLVGSQKSIPGGRSIMRLLTRRCGADPRTARRIVDMMETNDGNINDGRRGSSERRQGRSPNLGDHGGSARDGRNQYQDLGERLESEEAGRRHASDEARERIDQSAPGPDEVDFQRANEAGPSNISK